MPGAVAKRVLGTIMALLLLSACGRATSVASVTTSAVAPPTAALATATVAPAPSPTVATTAATSSSAASVTTTTLLASAAPTVAPTATPVPAIPVKLAIPAINVNAAVELVGLTPDGAMDVPKQWNDVGWYEYGPPPGQIGNSAIAGHLDSTTAPAVFWRLGTLKPGDKIIVTLSDGKTVTFAVKEKDSYAYNDAPIQQVFGPATTANLNLITCGGSWDAFTKNYSNRIVVYATKV